VDINVAVAVGVMDAVTAARGVGAGVDGGTAWQAARTNKKNRLMHCFID
jgi:hypothetical protein